MSVVLRQGHWLAVIHLHFTIDLIRFDSLALRIWNLKISQTRVKLKFENISLRVNLKFGIPSADALKMKNLNSFGRRAQNEIILKARASALCEIGWDIPGVNTN